MDQVDIGVDPDGWPDARWGKEDHDGAGWICFLFEEQKALNPPGAQRKARLATCACAHVLAALMPDDEFRSAIPLGEAYADGDADPASVRRSFGALKRKQIATFVPNPRYEHVPSPDRFKALHDPVAALAILAVCPKLWRGELLTSLLRIGYERRAEFRRPDRDLPELPAQIAFDIFGHPYKPISFDQRWLTTAVNALAAGIVADAAFDRLQILADALEDAGCDNAEMLAHARGPGPHCRGCWVLDTVRGKHWQPRQRNGERPA